jgi:hypothetical protein
VEQQFEQVLTGDVDHEVVHRTTTATLHDLDADHVAAHGADPGRDGTQSTRPIREPDTEDVDGHGRAP